MKRILTIASGVLLLCSCINEYITDPGQNDDRLQEIPVEFTICGIDDTGTRSSISASETSVRDINIYAYSNGKLEKAAYFESTQSFVLSLAKDLTYNLYALSNMGRLTPPDLEEEMLRTKFSMGPMSYISGGFPMSWSRQGFTINESDPRVNVTLVRLVSKICFSLDRSALDDFSVTSVRLCQSASCVYPFALESKAESPSEVINGDYASPDDLNAINSGKGICFYAYENCQGVLLPGNPNADSKIPINIPANSRLCTYLEMTASFSGQYDGVDVSSNNVKYRFYLGADNCSDFNVKRNTDIRISLKVTQERIFDESWRVSYGEELPDVSYGLEILQEDVEIGLGLDSSLSANYYRIVDGTRDRNEDVTDYAAWTSSDESIATVSGGVVTGVSKGTATITATYNGYRSTSIITVKDVTSYRLNMSPENMNLVIGRSGKMTAVFATLLNGTQINGTEVSSKCVWKSSDSSVATVDGIGMITAVNFGTAEITAEYEGLTATGTVTVVPLITYELALSPGSLSIYKGASRLLSAIYKVYEDGVLQSSTDVTESATWSTGSSRTATVNKGYVTGVGLGSTKITASYNGLDATATVLVKGTPTLSLGWTSKTLERGDVITNTAIYNLNDGTSPKNVTSAAVWTTSNSGVATVGGGSITAQGPGTAIITASYNGIRSVCVVTVTEDVYIDPNAHVTSVYVTQVNLAENLWKIMLSIRFSNGTVIDDVPYKWNVTYAQNPEISTSTSSEDPIIYQTGGTNSLMEVGITTTKFYKDSNGSTRQFNILTTFSHSVDWKP